MGRALGLSLLLTSCSFDAGVSALQEVRCASDLECPAGLLCQTHRQRCRPTEGFDDTPPALLSSELKLVPLEAGALVTAWGPASTLALSAALTEPVVYLALRLRPPLAADCNLRVEQLQVSASCALTGPVGEVPVAIALEAVDGAGLTATLPLGTVQVDDVAPAAPDVDTEGATLLVQAPFGSIADPLASVELQVEAAPSVALEVFQGASQVLRLETNVEAPATKVSARLPATSAATRVRSVDAAGNHSALVPVRWVDTLAAPQPQLRYDSPHRVARDEVGTGVGAPLAAGLGAGQTVLGKGSFQPALRAQTYLSAPPLAEGIEPWSRRRILDTWPPQFQSGTAPPRAAWADDGGRPERRARFVDVHRRVVWFAEARPAAGGWLYTAHQVEGDIHRVVGSTVQQPVTLLPIVVKRALAVSADQTGVLLRDRTTSCLPNPFLPSFRCEDRTSDDDTWLAFRSDGGVEFRPFAPFPAFPFDDEPDTLVLPFTGHRVRTSLRDGGELLFAISGDGEASCLAGQEPPVCASLTRGAPVDTLNFPSGEALPIPPAQWGGLQLRADAGVVMVVPAAGGTATQVQVFPDGGLVALRAFPAVPSLTATMGMGRGTLYFVADGGYGVLDDGAGLTVEPLPPMRLPALTSSAPGGRTTVDGAGHVHFIDDGVWLERLGPGDWRARPLEKVKGPFPARWDDLVWSSEQGGFLANGGRLEWQKLRPNLRLQASVQDGGLPLGVVRRVWLEAAGSAEAAAADGGTSQALVLSTWLAGRLARGAPGPSPRSFEVPMEALLGVPEDTLTWVVEPEGTNFADRPARLTVEGAQVRFRTFTAP